MIDLAFLSEHYFKMFIGLLAMADPLKAALSF